MSIHKLRLGFYTHNLDVGGIPNPWLDAHFSKQVRGVSCDAGLNCGQELMGPRLRLAAGWAKNC